jgi:amino acid transporter
MSERKPGTEMPKWLLYGLIGKGALVVVVTVAVVVCVNWG